jgi:hypothetical protein
VTPTFNSQEAQYLLHQADKVINNIPDDSKPSKGYNAITEQGYESGRELIKYCPSARKQAGKYRINVEDFLLEIADSPEIQEGTLPAIEIALGFVLETKQAFEAKSGNKNWTIAAFTPTSKARAQAVTNAYQQYKQLHGALPITW